MREEPSDQIDAVFCVPGADVEACRCPRGQRRSRRNRFDPLGRHRQGWFYRNGLLVNHSLQSQRVARNSIARYFSYNSPPSDRHFVARHPHCFVQSNNILALAWLVCRTKDETMFSRVILLAVVASFAASTSAQDWPQWNGPNRDGSYPAGGIRRTIPDDGLPLVWRQPVRFGYAGPIVAEGKTFVCDYVKTSGEIANNAGARDKLTGRERVSCFDAATGKPLWQYDYDRSYAVSYGGGPRATPCYHDGLLYMLGSEGDLTAIRVDRGEKVWHRQFNEEFGAKTPMWGHTASPLVEDDKLICLVGGTDSLVVAFDLKSGEVIWQSLSSADTGYCPPVVIEHGGQRQLVVWSPTTISGLDPASGDVVWQAELKPDYGMSILPAAYDNGLLFTSGEGQSLMLQLDASGQDVAQLWRGRPTQGVYLATSNCIFRNGHLYGADVRSGALICARATDGERLWQTARPTTGSKRARGGAHGSAFLVRLIAADGTGDDYLMLSETGEIISATLTPEQYVETGRFQAIKPLLNTMGRTVLWTYPAIADGKLFIRNDEEVVCYSLAE